MKFIKFDPDNPPKLNTEYLVGAYWETKPTIIEVFVAEYNPFYDNDWETDHFWNAEHLETFTVLCYADLSEFKDFVEKEFKA